MFAVVRTGGKQYKVARGDYVHVERLQAEPGAALSLDDVLLVSHGDTQLVGAPRVEGASVATEVIGHERSDKVIVFKKRKRQNYRRKKGHRQHYTVLKVLGISAAGVEDDAAADDGADAGGQPEPARTGPVEADAGDAVPAEAAAVEA